MPKIVFSLLALALLGVPFLSVADEDVVISDEGVSLSYAEMEASLRLIPESLRAAAANDVGERFELLNNMLQMRKLAQKAEDLTPEVPGYWELQFEILALKRNFVYRLEQTQVEFPDPEALAQEYYETQKDRFATKPETRASSHILLASPPGLPREGVREEAQRLLDELRAGADFEEMVESRSQDPGSKARGGSLDAWMRYGDPQFTPPYSEALFTIENVGEYAEITDSQFGIHIIRLDGIREGGYYPYEEVRENIYKAIAQEFRDLAAKEIATKYNITDDAFIDGAAMEELFAPYKTE